MVKAILLLLTLMLTPFSSLAGLITVQENGKIRTYSTDTYVVVKRRPKKKVVVVKPQPEASPAPVQTTVVQVVTIENKKNRIRLMGGVGRSDFSVTGGPQFYSVNTAEVFVAGVAYSRLITGPWSLDAQAITNKTFTLGVGFDF